LRREPTPPAKIKVNVWFFILTASSLIYLSIAPASSITDILAKYTVNTATSDIPESARQIARLSIVDWLAVSIAGREDSYIAKLGANGKTVGDCRWREC